MIACEDVSGDRLCQCMGWKVKTNNALLLRTLITQMIIFNQDGNIVPRSLELTAFSLLSCLSSASLVTDWHIVNISDVSARAMHIEWSLYSPGSPYHVVIYSIVCTPTNGEFGSTVLNVNVTNVRKADVGRLHYGTNYSVELVAFVKNTQTGGFSLRRSQKAYFETFEGGKS